MFDASVQGDSMITLQELWRSFRAAQRWLLTLPLVAAAAAFGATYLMTPIFSATTTFLPPQQQSSSAQALAGLGSLAGLAGAAGLRASSAEQYIALMQSATVSNRVIDHFKLMDHYKTALKTDARTQLASAVSIGVGKKDGLITVTVDDRDAQLAADIANRYVEELRHVTANLAVTEAQQRRVFFERHLQQARDGLVKAQQALQASGFNPGALKAEPRAAAEAYASLKAQVSAADLRLQRLRGTLADSTPEVRQQAELLATLNARLVQAEQPGTRQEGPDYISRYREFKYQEAMFDVYARQFELARADESREGSLIQVVDVAVPAERRSRPKRVWMATTAGASAFGLVAIGVLLSALARPRRAIA